MFTHTQDEYNALNELIEMEQLTETNDEVNEFWNTIRRKLRENTLIDSHCGSYKVLH